METTGPVLLFDGECGLCMRCVKVLLALDRGRRLKFASLQGATAQTFLHERGWPTDDFESAIFVADWTSRLEEKTFFKTDALLASLRAIGGFGRLLFGLKIVPRAWRDAFYDWIARRRKQFFGPVKYADFRTPDKRDRFLP